MSIYFPFALALSNMTSVRASRVLLALYALKLGAEPFAVGVLAATFSVLPMLLSWPAGKLSDRFGSRWLLMLGAAGGACGMLVPYFVPGMFALYVAAAMAGFSFTFYNVSLQNLVGLLSRPHERAQNFSNYSLVQATSSFLGPLCVGFAIDHGGFANACLLLVLLSLVAVVMLIIWGRALPGSASHAALPGSTRDDPASHAVWRVLVTSSLVVTGIDLFQFYLPIFGHGVGLSASAIGVVLAMFSAAAFVVRVIMPRLLARRTVEQVLAYSFFLGAVSFVMVPFSTNALALGVIAFLFGLGMGCGQPITMMLTFSHSAQGRSAEALGVRMTVNHLTRVIVPVVFGSIGSAFGFFPVFWLSAVLLASGGMLAGKDKTHSRPGRQ